MTNLSAIYSLPRSGSAWLSVFLSQPGSYCYHDPLADMTIDELLLRMTDRPESHVAFVDTSLYQRGVALHPKICTYVLLRESSQVERSIKLKGWLVDVDTERNRLLKASHGSLDIQYSKLNNIEYLAELWFRMVGTSLDRERTEYLIEMNIQRYFAAVAKRVASCTI